MYSCLVTIGHMVSIPTTVSIWREVDTSGVSLEVKDSANERRILVRKSVVLLTGPGGGLEVVERSVRRSEVGLLGHLDELGVLDHHRLCNADEGLIRWEQGNTSSHRVTLKHPWE